MGFWSKLGKIGMKVAPYAAMAIPGVGIPLGMAIQGGLAAAQKKASGGSWKDALISGGIGAATSAIPVKGLGPSATAATKIGSSVPALTAGGAAKQGVGSIFKTIGKNAAGSALENLKQGQAIPRESAPIMESDTGIGPSAPAMGRMDQSNPNLAYALQRGKREALMDQPWRRQRPQPYEAGY